MMNEVLSSQRKERLRTVIRGAVQGVGFRPFIHRLASDMELAGWVSNGNEGVLLEVEGPSTRLQQFLLRLNTEKPALARIHSLEPVFLDPIGMSGFSIRESHGGRKSAFVVPDIATCAECLQDISHPGNRRYRYPFTNCTHCGPRYSFLEALPYDRAQTTMKSFAMCLDCQREYNNPLDRRFHAQPIACPACGPQLELWTKEGTVLGAGHAALRRTAQALRDGRIVAIKGLGGFHLCVDAQNETAVRTLRQRKHRQEKPFALMVPSLASAQALCDVSEMEQRLLVSAESPIVLMVRKKSADCLGAVRIAESVASGNPFLGLMLPYTPLHHLLLKEFPFPIVATSGNLSEEPICIDERDALKDLGDLADLFLVHNRPIARPVDDSIVMMVEGREMLLRRARGYAPLPITLNHPAPRILAVGGQSKNAVAISIDNQVFVSQHIGDLETTRAYDSFQNTITSFESLYAFQAEQIACDLHTNYLSTRYAHQRKLPVVPVQHHYAHILSCMADNNLEGPALGVAWDGTGYGLDHTVWGGEFLQLHATGFERVAHLRTFRLPGSEKSVREPRRSALGVLAELFGESVWERLDLAPLQAFSASERVLLKRMFDRSIQSPLTSSAGRLFDAVASLLGLRQVMSFEGQAAMDLEFLAMSHRTEETYPLEETDWGPMLVAILKDLERKTSTGIIASKFHNTLIEMMIQVARRVREPRVVLSGGCFQNRYLLTRAIRRLRDEGFHPYWHQRIPPNDGGIGMGQIMALARQTTPREVPLCV